MDQNRNDQSNSRTWLNAEIPSEIGRAEDGVKEAIVNSKESVVKNVKIVGNSVSNHVEKGTTVVRHRAKQFGSKFEEIRTNVKDKIWDGRLLKYSELPEWMKDNEFITALHRPEIRNAYTCLTSIFYIHAETGNIWTHLLGALAFLSFIIYYIFLPTEDNFVSPTEEKTVAIGFFACAFICLTFSTSFHTFGCHSHSVCVFCGRLDYTGIAVLITGSFLPWVYYSFYCARVAKYVYMGSVLGLGIICTLVSMDKKFQLPKYRTHRAALFLVFGLVGLIPCVHTVVVRGIDHSFSEGQMQWLVLMGLVYVTGTVFFMTRFPECVWPGKFNLVLQSHQIFHVFVVAAALIQTYAIYNMKNNRLKLGGICDAE